jgi:phage host-nuclease inhibitor protein Gam
MATTAKKSNQEKLDLRPGLKTVDDLDGEIREVASLTLAALDVENDMQQELMSIEKKFGPELKRLKEQLAARTDGVLDFARAHKASVFGSAKSRKFNYGTLKLTTESSKVVFTVDEVQVIANLERFGWDRGVVMTVKSVNKNALKAAVPEDKQAKVGFEIVKTGGAPQLTIDKRQIEVLRDAEKRTKKAS